jgi:hypothetical protein
LKKIKYKNFKEMADLRLRKACGGCKQTIRGIRGAKGEVEPG